MTNSYQQKKIVIKGEVIEIYTKEGKQIIKLSGDPGLFEISIENFMDVHLGDELSLNGNFFVEKIIQEIHNNRITK